MNIDVVVPWSRICKEEDYLESSLYGHVILSDETNHGTAILENRSLYSLSLLLRSMGAENKM